MNTFHLEIVTPDGPTFKGEVESLVLPAWEGQLGVLPGHEPMVVVMKPGPLRYQTSGKEEWVAVSGGFAQIAQDKVILLAETAEIAEAIDAARAKAKVGEKQHALNERHGMSAEEVSRMEASLLKELIRVKVAERAKKG
jgi:F-type H+-transporting ATPase subunit epsilon